MQGIMEDEFTKPENFSQVAYARKNAEGDIVSEKGKLLPMPNPTYSTATMLSCLKGEYRKNNDGSITIYKGNRLKLFTQPKLTELLMSA